jgi:hypothetical protein
MAGGRAQGEFSAGGWHSRAGARAAYLVRGIVQNGMRGILFAARTSLVRLLERPKYTYAWYIGGFLRRGYCSASEMILDLGVRSYLFIQVEGGLEVSERQGVFILQVW